MQKTKFDKKKYTSYNINLEKYYFKVALLLIYCCMRIN